MVNSCAVCGCCTRTDIVREHLEDTLGICDVSAKGLLPVITAEHPFLSSNIDGNSVVLPVLEPLSKPLIKTA